MSKRTDYILPPPSVEQQVILDCIRDGYNVATAAVAGAGKTTTILNAASVFAGTGLDGNITRTSVASITYNAKLKLDTREKAAVLGLVIDVHTYHSFCVKHYTRKCFTDVQIKALLVANTPPIRPFSIDLLFVDECQDMTPLFHELICKICADSVSGPPQLCVLGDKRQCINQHVGADERFLTHVSQVLDVNGREWRFPKISQSFRVTRPMADFVNYCMLNDLPGKETIRSEKSSIVLPSSVSSTTRTGTKYTALPTYTPAPKPRYLMCNAFGEEVLNELLRYLEMGYEPSEIAVVAVSIKSEGLPIRQLENNLKRARPDIQIFVPTGDDERLDLDVIQGKLVFSTFTQTKGLEWPVVIVVGADNSYFEYFAKDLPPSYCPNQLYVPATRALHWITFVHHNENDYLPFLNVSKLSRYCDVIVNKRLMVKRRGNGGGEKKTAVTDLVRFIPQTVLDDCRNLLTLVTIRKPDHIIDIASKSTQQGGVENVSELTGTAIPAFYDMLRNGKIGILEEMKRERFERSLASDADSGLLDDVVGSTVCGFSSDEDAPVVKKIRADTKSKVYTSAAKHQALCGFSDDEENVVATKNNPVSGKKAAPATTQAKAKAKAKVQSTKDAAMGDREKPFTLETIDIQTLTIAELLYIANCWCAYVSGIQFKVFQIKQYNWINDDQLDACVDRMDSLKISIRGTFEKKLIVSGRSELMGRVLSGVIDCLDGMDTFEFKCTTALATEHVLQLAIYMYMRNIELHKKADAASEALSSIFSRYYGKITNPNAVPIQVLNPGQLYNILTDELITVENDMDTLTEVVRILMNHKYGPKRRITDPVFVAAHTKVVDRYRTTKA